MKFLHDKHSYGTEKLHSEGLAQFQVRFCMPGIKRVNVTLERSGLIFEHLKTEKKREGKKAFQLSFFVGSRVVNCLSLNRVLHFMHTMTHSLLKKTGKAYECYAIVSK